MVEISILFFAWDPLRLMAVICMYGGAFCDRCTVSELTIEKYLQQLMILKQRRFAFVDILVCGLVSSDWYSPRRRENRQFKIINSL